MKNQKLVQTVAEILAHELGNGEAAKVHVIAAETVLADPERKSSTLYRAMIASGHALPWAPGPKAKFDRQQHWCGGVR